VLPTISLHAPQGIPDRYILVTLHRPSSVDDLAWLSSMLQMLSRMSQNVSVVFPVHPRTRQRMVRIDAGVGKKGDTPA
jgi:UDP-N-acetylglucosamine 2-epimerase (non-hydrolysing)